MYQTFSFLKILTIVPPRKKLLKRPCFHPALCAPLGALFHESNEVVFSFFLFYPFHPALCGPLGTLLTKGNEVLRKEINMRISILIRWIPIIIQKSLKTVRFLVNFIRAFSTQNLRFLGKSGILRFWLEYGHNWLFYADFGIPFTCFILGIFICICFLVHCEFL